jgi:hypothetical protein
LACRTKCEVDQTKRAHVITPVQRGRLHATEFQELPIEAFQTAMKVKAMNSFVIMMKEGPDGWYFQPAERHFNTTTNGAGRTGQRSELF